MANYISHRSPLPDPLNNISPDAKIDKHANLNQYRRPGDGVKPITIESGCTVLWKTSIKENVIIHSNVYIDSDVHIGKNVEIGSGTKVGTDTKIEDSVHIGKDVKMESRTLIRKQAWIGDNVDIRGKHIGVGVRLGNGVLVMSDIGDETTVGKSTRIFYDAKIGRRVVIGEKVTVDIDSEIGDSAEIGNNVYLVRGVKIGARAIIEEGKTVEQDVAAGGRY